MSLAQCWPRYMRDKPGVSANAYAGTATNHVAAGSRRLTSATNAVAAANPDAECIEGNARC